MQRSLKINMSQNNYSLRMCLRSSHVLVVIPEATLRESATPNVTVREFGSVSVVCDVTGTPPPNVTWTFGSRTVMNGSEFSLSRMETLTSENNNVTSTLTILNANREDLDTIVSCEASNGVGTDVKVSTLLVVECMLI